MHTTVNTLGDFLALTFGFIAPSAFLLAVTILVFVVTRHIHRR